MTKELFNCTWEVTEYTTDNTELFHKDRLHMVCVASHNEIYPVGSIIDCAK